MKLSIILPVYNAENYLERCLDSILNQTFKNFEVILINDGSKDDSYLICEKYALKDDRIKYFNQENQGVAMARNQGLKVATGTHIGFIDADDYIEADMFQNLVNPFLSHNNLQVVIAHYKICNSDSNTIPKTTLPINKVLDKNEVVEYILQSYYKGGDPLVPALWNKIYDKVFLDKHNFIFHNQKAVRASDYWFNFEVFQTLSSAYVIQNADYCYNNEITGSIINSFRENQFEGFLASNKKLLDANKTFNFNINYKNFYSSFINNTNQFILLAIKNKGVLGAHSLVNKILKNKEFIASFKYVEIHKKHVKLIYNFLQRGLRLPAYIIYYLWSFKIS